MLLSNGKHRRSSKAVRMATLAGCRRCRHRPPADGRHQRLRRLRRHLGRRRPVRVRWQLVHQHRQRLLRWPAVLPVELGRRRWHQVRPRADLATKEQQIATAEVLLDLQGPGAWGCAGAGNLTNDGVDPGVSTGSSSTAETPKSTDTSTSTGSSQSSGSAAPQSDRASESQTASRSEDRPAASEKSETVTTPTGGKVEKGDGEYKVVTGDTLSTIAQKQSVKGGWQKLFKLNHDIVDDADLIFPGQQLHLK